INLTVNGLAEKAGLKVGDQIISIDNIKANEGDNCEVVRLISELDGKSMQHNLIIKRGTETLSFQL
ncbi:MAG: PDZ domain-containing protein, partial [Lentimicrobium sp.]|nr:PDZ domain-containing protein [Lentimicrobium sp.]